MTKYRISTHFILITKHLMQIPLMKDDTYIYVDIGHDEHILL